jgi:nitrogen fixation/metabolism regulation signal transduction histidine kinase
MGLAMVQETVNRHAGVLRLTNREEGGCRVLVCLPISVPQLCEEKFQEQS